VANQWRGSWRNGLAAGEMTSGYSWRNDRQRRIIIVVMKKARNDNEENVWLAAKSGERKYQSVSAKKKIQRRKQYLAWHRSESWREEAINGHLKCGEICYICM